VFGFSLLTTRSILANIASPDRGAMGAIVRAHSDLFCCRNNLIKLFRHVGNETSPIFFKTYPQLRNPIQDKTTKY
jgi:hypothetical protein